MNKVRVPRFVRIFFPHAVWRGDKEAKKLYLTFDDGPIPEVTPWVLNCLKENHIKATFFCIGDNVRKNPQVYDQIKSEGHKIGNHSFNHLKGWRTPNKEYVGNVEAAQKSIHSNLFRPPYGKIKPLQVWKLRKEYKIIMWDVLSRDYDVEITKEKCLANVLDYSRPGSIIVFHDSLKAREKLEYTLPKVIEHFSKQGYSFETL